MKSVWESIVSMRLLLFLVKKFLTDNCHWTMITSNFSWENTVLKVVQVCDWLFFAPPPFIDLLQRLHWLCPLNDNQWRHCSLTRTHHRCWRSVGRFWMARGVSHAFAYSANFRDFSLLWRWMHSKFLPKRRWVRRGFCCRCGGLPLQKSERAERTQLRDWLVSRSGRGVWRSWPIKGEFVKLSCDG